MEVEFAGELLVLDAERAVYWPARNALLVADTHFGKAGVFRAAGVPIPEGIDAHDLGRLSRLLHGHGASRLIVLGDFFHGRPRHSSRFVERFDAWLCQHAGLDIDVVTGNHDLHGGAGRWNTRLRWHAASLHEPPFELAHQADPRGAGAVLCGHVHPMMHLNSRSGDHARLPAFWFTRSCVTLPAFGRFTGGSPIRRQAGDRVFVIAESKVIALQD